MKGYQLLLLIGACCFVLAGIRVVYKDFLTYGVSRWSFVPIITGIIILIVAFPCVNEFLIHFMISDIG